MVSPDDAKVKKKKNEKKREKRIISEGRAQLIRSLIRSCQMPAHDAIPHTARRCAATRSHGVGEGRGCDTAVGRRREREDVAWDHRGGKVDHRAEEGRLKRDGGREEEEGWGWVLGKKKKERVDLKRSPTRPPPRLRGYDEKE